MPDDGRDGVVDTEVCCGSEHPEFGACELEDGHISLHVSVSELACWPENEGWCIGGDNGAPSTEVEYAIEPTPGACARCHTDDIVTTIEELPDYRDGARLIKRRVTYGPWEYVTPEEIDHA